MKSLLYFLSILFIALAIAAAIQNYDDTSDKFIFVSVMLYGIAYIGEKIEKLTDAIRENK